MTIVTNPRYVILTKNLNDKLSFENPSCINNSYLIDYLKTLQKNKLSGLLGCQKISSLHVKIPFDAFLASLTQTLYENTSDL